VAPFDTLRTSNSVASEAEKAPLRAKATVEDGTAKAVTIQNVLLWRNSATPLETPRLRVIVSLRGALRQACPERSRRAQDKLRDEAISF
jgi:hypothetical protein